jgi:ribonuclease P protein component
MPLGEYAPTVEADGSMNSSKLPQDQDRAAARYRQQERKRWRSTDDGSALIVRRDFLAAARSGLKHARGGMVLQARPNGREAAPTIRVGLTASRKVGNAVVRNRAKRRLRALARDILIPEAAAGHDYVLIARGSTTGRSFDRLKSDLRACLKQLGLKRESPPRGGTLSTDEERSVREDVPNVRISVNGAEQ